jgi:hypothetical protein
VKAKSTIVAAILIGTWLAGSASAQLAGNEKEFREMAAALKANDTERRSAIATCIKQGIGENPAGAAQFMGVPMEKAAEAWCTRMTNGIADGRLGFADVNGLNTGAITPTARAVLTTTSEGK